MSKNSEQQPLVENVSSNTYGSNTIEGGDVSAIESNGSKVLLTSPRQEIYAISKSSLPLIVTFLLQYSLTVVSIFSVGHIGKTELAAVSLATMTFNVTSSIFNGMATCLDTFCSQAYGAKKYNLVGLYFQRCTAMILVMSIPLVVAWCFSFHFLKYIVTDLRLAYLAQSYLRVIAFGVPGYIFFETGKRFLQAQGIFVAGQYSLFICAPLNILLNYLLVWNSYIGIGFLGAPLATAICYWGMSFLLLSYALFIDGKNCWSGLKLKESFRHWGPMMTLALNGTAMLLSEFIAFEILTLSAASLGTSVLAAQSIVSTMATLAFQIPFSISVAASTRIANFIGGGYLKSAQIATNVSLIGSLFVGIFNFSILFFFKGPIARSFTSDKSVYTISLSIISILAVNQLYDCLNVLAAGCLRGQGRQQVGSTLNLIAYYIVAVPLALTLAFKFDWGIKGLWSGLGCGVLILALSETYFVVNSDWTKIVEEADKRNNAGEVPA
ncbi:hypothetical protein PACTADRAFT_725 [Pachysolen tannophilus NRRL Y-2460]|uniref:MATE efflux family protein n=1 Tax=Pachysolen tannophilus NRRL Y-2460 TaxID=669874 RepID=A0A1E4U2M0_PACTA|nr:hypothetical protein PACTADRAFT_725 [Pachysolen tannophilus NRRL Y-2460]